MILAAVWKLKQNGGGYGLPITYDQTRELAAIDASIQVLEFCGQRNPFARRYSILIKDLQRQLALVLSTEASPSSAPPVSSMSSSASVTDLDPVVESPNIQDLRISIEQSSGPTLESSRTFVGRASYSSDSPLNINLEGWPPRHFGTLCPENGESSHSKSSLLTIMFCSILSTHILTCEQISHPPFYLVPMSIISGTKWGNSSYMCFVLSSII